MTKSLNLDDYSYKLNNKNIAKFSNKKKIIQSYIQMFLSFKSTNLGYVINI